MKILNVTAQKPDSTGSGVYLAEMVRCQAAAGHEVAVICGVGPGDKPTLPQGVLVSAVRFETDELPFAVCGMSDEMPYAATRYCDLTPAMVRQFENAFTQAIQEIDTDFQPDIIICHHLYLLTTLVRELLPHRVVGAVSHSTDLRQMGKHNLERERIAAAIQNLEVVFALHEDQKREIERVYQVDPARICVVGTGYNSEVFCLGEEHCTSDTNHAHRPVKLVYVGKIAEKKGIASLLEAIDCVEVGPAGLSLQLIGGSGSESEYQRLYERAQKCRYPVEFAGKVSQADLVHAYQQADVFVLPSFYEGLPLVVVEALACGCKVVVSDLPGINPWLEQHVVDAPVVYVPLPRMASVDEPVREDLPAFETRLAHAIERAVSLPSQACNTKGISWEHLTDRVVILLAEAQKRRYTVTCR